MLEHRGIKMEPENGTRKPRDHKWNCRRHQKTTGRTNDYGSRVGPTIMVLVLETYTCVHMVSLSY